MFGHRSILNFHVQYKSRVWHVENLPTIMSFATHLNGSMPLSDHWSGYLAHAQANLPPLNSRFALIAILNIPLLVIILNALAQLVRTTVFLPLNALIKNGSLDSSQSIRTTCRLPLASHHWFGHLVWKRSPEFFLQVSEKSTSASTVHSIELIFF